MTSIPKAFNTHFNEFLEDVSLVLPNDRNIKTAKFYVDKINKMNPILIIKAWYIYCVVPYSEQINNGDFTFFINKDYKKDVEESEYNSPQILDAIESVRIKAAQLGNEDQNKVIKYVQNLSKLSMMYNKK